MIPAGCSLARSAPPSPAECGDFGAVQDAAQDQRRQHALQCRTRAHRPGPPPLRYARDPPPSPVLAVLRAVAAAARSRPPLVDRLYGVRKYCAQAECCADSVLVLGRFEPPPQAGRGRQAERMGSRGWAAFRYRDFRLFCAARFCIALASQILMVAVAWHVYDVSRDALALGLVGPRFVPADDGARARHRPCRGPLQPPHHHHPRLRGHGACRLRRPARASGGRGRPPADLSPAGHAFGTSRAFANPAQQAIVPSLVPARRSAMRSRGTPRHSSPHHRRAGRTAGSSLRSTGRHRSSSRALLCRRRRPLSPLSADRVSRCASR